MLRVLERGSTMGKRYRPSLAFVAHDATELAAWEDTISIEPAIAPVAESYDPSKAVTINVRLPPALHERLEALRWELRCSLSEVIRGVLWERCLSTSFEEVADYTDEPPIVEEDR